MTLRRRTATREAPNATAAPGGAMPIFANWFVAASDPLAADPDRVVRDPLTRARARMEYAQLAAWTAMPDDEAVALKLAEALEASEAKGFRPTEEQIGEFCRQIMDQRERVRAEVARRGPAPGRDVIVSVLVGTLAPDGTFTPDPSAPA